MTLACVAGQARYIEGGINLLPCGNVVDIFIHGAGGNDAINVPSVSAADFPLLTRVILDGGTGTDTINGSQVADTIEAAGDTVNAGPGNDAINGGQQINAGEGDDVMTSSEGSVDAGPGNDRFQIPSGLGPYGGGAGFDTFSYDLGSISQPITVNYKVDDSGFDVDATVPPSAPVHFRVSWSSIDRGEFVFPNAGTQMMDASLFTGELHADGRGGPDSVVAGPGENFLTGGSGDDVLEGGKGFDYVDGGPGADTLKLRDRATDRGRCGTEADTAIADAADALSDCETVDLPDATPPETTIASGPTGSIPTASAAFAFNSSETGSSFQCKLDGGDFAACDSPKNYGSLADGSHTFSVKATDGAGNTDASPATRTFAVTAAACTKAKASLKKAKAPDDAAKIKKAKAKVKKAKAKVKKAKAKVKKVC